MDYWEWKCGGSIFKRADFQEYVTHFCMFYLHALLFIPLLMCWHTSDTFPIGVTSNCDRIKSVRLSILNFSVSFNLITAIECHLKTTWQNQHWIVFRSVSWQIFSICRKLLRSARWNMWELLGDRVFWIIGRVIVDSAISSSHYPAIRSWMVRDWQLHCCDFENLDFAKYLADSSVPIGDFAIQTSDNAVRYKMEMLESHDLLTMWRLYG